MALNNLPPHLGNLVSGDMYCLHHLHLAHNGAVACAQDGLVEERLEDSLRIRKVTARYLYSAERPPFTTPQLIAMAIICGPDSDISTENVVCWIIRRFYYYKILVQDEYDFAKAARVDKDKGPTGLEMLIDGSCKTFPCNKFLGYDNPIQVWDPDPDDDDDLKPELFYSIKENHARLFLSGLLEPERKGAFRLLDLPAELRVRIYEMALHFDDCEITTRCKPGFKFGLSRSSHLFNEDYRIWHAKMHDHEDPMPLPLDVESLLIASRQVRHETLPIFYGTNNFSFSKTRSLWFDLRRYSTQELSLMKKITIHLNKHYRISTYRYPDVAARALARLPALDECSFVIDDEDWADYQDRGSPKYEDLEELDGIVDLAARAKKVKVYTEEFGCEKFRAFIDEAVARRQGIVEEIKEQD
ncbi:hypothetical protein PRZ48_002444 [Zasmidium cellare]|uniref:Fork-head domain-containing protein n=1 Tax=Zasmidium cellare TaxID=395010 RepID=A0ABR0F605_ZASCE|nr:hypothetical protein PRZ48_002444 [Zasmidium cellare]